MERTPPRLYLFFGEDDFSMAEAVAGLRGRLGDPATGDMNAPVLSRLVSGFRGPGRGQSIAPFLSSRRLVVIEGAEDLPRRRLAEQLERLLQASPPTTALVLLEQFDFSDAARQARRSGKRTCARRTSTAGLSRSADGLPTIPMTSSCAPSPTSRDFINGWRAALPRARWTAQPPKRWLRRSG
jgi:hypothetical protein